MAVELGFDHGNLATAETGLHNPTIHTVSRMLPCLRVTMTEFAAALPDQGLVSMPPPTRDGAQTEIFLCA
jgi:hypothetical protein